ncbi:hypothetical protein DESUT3_35140 [Desulfuromonas versatilis]|uniref:Pyridoxamine 5'-phosphate oxidase N-terminal domain-containing protein n=1 Tax=Desulfuromonas versatilis TaxID=2802975 RepID=A0ABN6E262_9BACT|nr:pyridoxamine 5'-phosphate oxidase family protein [Desulfuromonas versatilis]BCR06445.1 hypothetical protein DESUT3_35140 [Desulfuromonas versatilis]
MISERMKIFIEKVNLAFVASADLDGEPHLGAGRGLEVTGPNHLVFEAWFCRKTLNNVAQNPQVAIAVMDPESEAGYQLRGIVEKVSDVAMLNGYVPRLEEPGMPQVQSRIAVRIDKIMEFSHGAHTDNPLSKEA